nr:transposase [Chloroflexus sp.]
MDFSVPLVHYNAVTRKAYPSDVSDERRKYPLCDVSNGLRSMLRTGAPWRMLPTDVPPWYVVDHQTQHWLTAGVCEQMLHAVRMLLRDITDRTPRPRAVS